MNIKTLKSNGGAEHGPLTGLSDREAFYAEAERREREALDKLEAVLNHAGNGITAIALRDEKPEFLFANDRYFEIVGYTRDEYAQATESDMFAPVYADDREEMRRKVLECNQKRGDTTVEYRVVRRDGSMVWVRSVITITTLSGIDVPVQIAVFSDITEEREASEQLRFLNSSAHDILAQPDSEQAINDTLKKLLCYFAADRSYIVELDHAKGLSDNTYEVCRDGAVSQRAKLQAVPFKQSDFWYAELSQGRYFVITSVSELDGGAAALRELLAAQGIGSLILAPLKRDGELLGFVGADNPTKAVGQIERLTALADYIAILLTRRDLERKIANSNEMERQLMNDTPGGFLRMEMRAGENPAIVSFNDGFCGMLGMTGAEIMEAYGADAFKCLTAEDIETVSKDSAEAYAGCGQFTSKCRLRRKDGSRLWVMVFGRFLHGDDNRLFLNAYFTDISTQMEQESQLKLLTSSIPGGLAAYSITQDGISIIYFNDGFFQFSGYSREEYADFIKDDPLAFVFEEDKPQIRALIHGFADNMVEGHVNGCVYRCHTRDGGYRWMSMKTVLSKDSDGQYIVNVVQLDITEQQEEKERLRVSEEFNRIAIEQSGNIITRFDVRSRTLTLPDAFNPIFVLPHVLMNMPEEQIALGRVSPDTADAYRELFYSIVRGSAAGTATYKQNSSKGWRWLEAQYTTVFASSGEPVSAVVSFMDVTEKLEKEVVYNKWQQSLVERPEDSYTLFRCNLSKDAALDSREGKLLRIDFNDDTSTFDERTIEYANLYVYSEDRERYLAFLNSNTMLAQYYRGHRSDTLEYREADADGTVRWLRLSVDLVEYPSSKDVEAYLMYENIDEQKRADLLTIEHAENDPLTGILNRATFISRMESVLKEAEAGSRHALFMLDVDNFKFVNDTLGHGAGDQVLRDLTRRIGAILRRNDLMGRLGGDEFFVFLRNIPNKEAAAAKARQICELQIAAEGTDTVVTASIGIAMVPDDGCDFDTLYKKADAALYQRKAHGKNGYLFVTE